MPRPERPLDALAGPVQAFAAELRKVREDAGNPKYLQMSRSTGRSRTALAEAAGGDRLATWETVEAYLRACGQNPSEWLKRWEAARAAIQETKAPPIALTPLPPGTTRDAAGRRSHQKKLVMVAAGAALAGGAVVLGVTLWLTSGSDGIPLHLAGTASDPPVLIVQNKVAVGATGFYEDITPEYLSKVAEPRCAEYGCEVPGTTMWSGDLLEPMCQLQGATMTNENLSSPGIQDNPHGQTSSLWFQAKTSTGVVGYISQAYLTPASGDGLGLPQCPPP